MSAPALAGMARGARAFALRLPLLYLALFFFYPLLAICVVSFNRDGQLELEALARILSRPYYRERLFFTLAQAALSTLLTLALALPAAQALATYRFRGRGALLALATLPFVLPTVVVAAAFKALLGDAGLLNRALMTALQLSRPPLILERSLALILLTHVFYNYAIALHILSGYWRTQSLRMEEAARALGCSPLRLWREVRLPLLRPALFSAAALVFVFCFTSFGVVLLLGDVGHATLEVAIYRQVNIDLPTAATLSLTQSGLMFLMMLGYSRWRQGGSGAPATLQSASSRARRPRGGEWIALLANVAIALLLVGAPLLALLWRSFTGSDGQLSAEHYANLRRLGEQSVLFAPPLAALGNSLQFALLTILLALPLGTLAAYWLAGNGKTASRWRALRDAVLMLPLTASAVTLGFGFTVMFASAATPAFLRSLRGSALLIPILHTLVALPFVLRCILPALRAITPNLREAAAALGAPPARRWLWLELPLLSRALFTGAVFAFVLSMGEFGASLFVIRPQKLTLPVAIYRLLGQPQPANFGMALALSALLLAICAAAFALLGRLRQLAPGALRW